MTDTYQRWPQQDLDALETAYFEVVLERFRAAGYSLADAPPTYEQLREIDCRGILYPLREHHDLTWSQFLDHIGVRTERKRTPDGTEPSDWQLRDSPTASALADYFTHLAERSQLAQTTLRTRFYRLRRTVRAYQTVHGSGAILEDVAERSLRENIQRWLGAFDALDGDFRSDAAAYRYYEATNTWFEWIQRMGYVESNPVERIRPAEDLSWERSGSPDNTALAPAQIRALVDACESQTETLLVVALCAWGLRTSEVAALSKANVASLAEPDPYLSFENRKNGPGTVALLYGRELLGERLADLDDGQEPVWLFPSPQADGGHISPRTVRRRFKAVAERAGVRVDGALPVPKMGRRFWYETYTGAVEAVVEEISGIAADQGSSDPSVVVQNYLSEERRREQRRERMRSTLDTVFGETERGGK